ncbi:MAG: ferredoxin--NADP reductase [Bdellovibrio sp.]|nr:ferredoxin--NADP reductase [Methylotenera sp.]
MDKLNYSDDLAANIPSQTATISSARFTVETVLSLRYWTPNLLSCRTSRDPNFRFTPGHYARLGLQSKKDNVIWRPFSVVSSKVDGYLEFIATLIPNGEFSDPLSNIREGDTIQVDKASYGFMTIDGFAPGKDLWLLATGTGLGPFLSILRDAITWNAFENIVLVHSVRYAVELAYRDEIQAIIQDHLLETLPARLRYIPVVTREFLPDMSPARIPQLIEDGRLEIAANLKFDLKRSRIMVCGNPEIIRELRGLFTARGFQTNRRAAPGQLAFENYWLNKP